MSFLKVKIPFVKMGKDDKRRKRKLRVKIIFWQELIFLFIK